MLRLLFRGRDRQLVGIGGAAADLDRPRRHLSLEEQFRDRRGPDGLARCSRIGAGTWIMRLMATIRCRERVGISCDLRRKDVHRVGAARAGPVDFRSSSSVTPCSHRRVVALLGLALLPSALRSLRVQHHDRRSSDLAVRRSDVHRRTSIWAFVWSYVESRPWIGYGFGGFWSIGTAAPVMQAGCGGCVS